MTVELRHPVVGCMDDRCVCTLASGEQAQILGPVTEYGRQTMPVRTTIVPSTNQLRRQSWKETIEPGNGLAGKNNGRAVAADHQAGGLAPQFAGEPEGKHDHDRDIGHGAADAGAGIQQHDANQAGAQTDADHGEAREQQGGCDEQPGTATTDQSGGGKDADQVSEEICRGNGAHLRV
jgi:hypothetical protein